MKRSYKIILVIASSMASVAMVLTFSGMLKMYRISSNANEPSQKVGSRIFVTNLKKPRINDFICFAYEDTAKTIRIYRLCGMANDVIEIRNGVLFRNGENADQDVKLIHTYKISMSEYMALRQSKAFPKNTMAFPISPDTIQTFLTDAWAKSENLVSKRVIALPQSEDKYIKAAYGQNWNKDHFGPLKIPKGKVFVLGDNRDNAEDSRYLGLIDEQAVVGIVL